MKKHSVFEVLLSCFFIVCMTGCFDSGGNYYFSINNSVDSGPDFVFVEGGTFNMGSSSGEDDERTVHSVSLSNFYINKHEVSQGEYEEIMETNPSFFWKLPITGEKQNERPVEQISWYDAIYFCNKKSVMEGRNSCYFVNGTSNVNLWGYYPHNDYIIEGNITCDFSANGYRLPTEAEWEYAARGGKKSKGYKYSGSNRISDVAWYANNNQMKTHASKRHNANELGLFDMSGNVWEWCWDLYGEYDAESVTDPTGASSGENRVIRGGSCANKDSGCTVTNRNNKSPLFKNHTVGLRLVCTDWQEKVFVEDKFVLVKEGSFYRDPGWIYVSNFYLSDHEVTQNEYLRIVGNNPSYFSNNPYSGELQENRPVENVSWYDAIYFCNKKSIKDGRTPCYRVNGVADVNSWDYIPNTGSYIYGEIYCDWDVDGYRLPTEAEWELAARGGSESYYKYYSGSWYINNVGWYAGNSSNITHEVRKKDCNELGLFDMSGNVWEWCWDWLTSYTDFEELVNPRGVSSGYYKVPRGGSWSNDESYCWIDYHYNSAPPEYCGNNYGFRIAYTDVSN